MDGGRKTVLAQHFPGEAAFLPLEEDGDAEGFAELAAVVRRDLPVEEARAAAVDLLMPEFDLLFRHSVVKEIEETSR